MTTQAKYTDGPLTFTAGEELAAYRRVKGSDYTTSPVTVSYADAGEDFIGVTLDNAESGDPIAVQPIAKDGSFLVEADEALSAGSDLYGADDGRVADTSSGTAYFKALVAATAQGDIIEAVLHPGVATTAGNVSITDSGGFTSTATVEAALQEIYQHIASAQAIAPVNLLGATEVDGTVLAAFSDGASTTPGIDTLGSEAIGIRWNNHANPDPIITNVVIPPDLDSSEDVVVHVLAAKTGATVGDATTFDVGAFFLTDGALYDADADAGDTTTAMTGDATAKTLQEETATISASDVSGAPGVISLTLQPTDGTLGTDDVIVVGLWLEYTRQILTS